MEHGEDKLKSFIEKISKVNPIITFKIEWPKNSTNFLNVTVSLTEEVIETDLYLKTTDSHQYLQANLVHYKKSIPLSQAESNG